MNTIDQSTVENYNAAEREHELLKRIEMLEHEIWLLGMSNSLLSKVINEPI